jgi:hypothetical protein
VCGFFLSTFALWAITIIGICAWAGASIYFKITYGDHKPLDSLGLRYGLMFLSALLLPMWFVYIFLHLHIVSYWK